MRVYCTFLTFDQLRLLPKEGYLFLARKEERINVERGNSFQTIVPHLSLTFSTPSFLSRRSYRSVNQKHRIKVCDSFQIENSANRGERDLEFAQQEKKRKEKGRKERERVFEGMKLIQGYHFDTQSLKRAREKRIERRRRRVPPRRKSQRRRFLCDRLAEKFAAEARYFRFRHSFPPFALFPPRS